MYLIDTSGEVIKTFDVKLTANQFNNGLARISCLDNNGKLKTDGFIDYQGNFVVPCIAEYLIEDPLDLIDINDDYSDGLIRIKQNGKYGFIDQNILIVIPFDYVWVSKFDNGIAAVKKNNKFGFINKYNELIIPFIFEGAKTFSEDFASVCINSKWGAINSFGETLIDFKYSNLGIMKNGELPACLDNKWGLITKEEKLIVPFKYDKLTHFHEGLCNVVYKNRQGVINRFGDAIFSSLIKDSEYNFLN